MYTWTITQGSKADHPFQLRNRGGQTTPVYTVLDSFTADVYRGQDQAALFSPAVAWYTAGGTQTGYDQGQVLVTISAAQAATLEAGGSYSLEIWWTQQTARVGRCALLVEPTAGAAAQAITPYCTYKDMLDHAPWIGMTQDRDADQEGYYSQRLQARRWLDDLIIGSWQGTSYASFGDPGFPASAWSGGWGGRTPLTSQWLRDKLAAGALMLREPIVRACAFKAISIVGLGQVGGQNQFARQGYMFGRMADDECLNLTAELDVNADGLADLPIVIGAAPVFYT